MNKIFNILLIILLVGISLCCVPELIVPEYNEVCLYEVEQGDTLIIDVSDLLADYHENGIEHTIRFAEYQDNNGCVTNCAMYWLERRIISHDEFIFIYDPVRPHGIYFDNDIEICLLPEVEL